MRSTIRTEQQRVVSISVRELLEELDVDTAGYTVARVSGGCSFTSNHNDSSIDIILTKTLPGDRV